jgi:hypothetical protein
MTLQSIAVTENLIGQLLLSAGFQPEFSPQQHTWFFTASVENEAVPVLVALPPGLLYLFVAAPIFKSNVHGLSIEEMDVATLRRLLRLSSAASLSKVSYMQFDDGTHLLAATSECSIEEVTGPKVRRRIEACALLSRQITQAFR